jgi:adenylate kinase
MAGGEAIVITGTPGVGKTEVAKMLSRETGRKLIELNAMAKEAGGIKGRDNARGASIVDIAAVRRALRKVLKGNQNVIIEGHFAEIVPGEFVKAAIVLRCNPLVLKERLARRGYPDSKIKENVEAELLDSCLIAAVMSFGDRVREIDTTGREVSDVTKEAERVLRGKGGLLAGSVNWISVLEIEGRLQDLIH